ncbi:MAG: hypothetical protein R6V40_04870 [Candidatus Moraniibacteriota bacterium]
MRGSKRKILFSKGFREVQSFLRRIGRILYSLTVLVALLAVWGFFEYSSQQQAAEALESAERFVKTGSEWGWFVKAAEEKNQNTTLTLLSKWEETVNYQTDGEVGVAIPYLKPCGMQTTVVVTQSHPAWEEFQSLQEGDRVYFSLQKNRETENWAGYLDPV